MLGIEHQRPPVRAGRLGVLAGLRVDVPQARVRLDDVGVDGKCLLHLGGGLVVPSGLRVAPGQLQQIVELDRVLRVAPGTFFEIPGAAAAHVAKRPQALFGGGVHGLWPLGGARGRGLGDERPQRPLQRVGPGGVGGRQVGQFLRVGREVVKLTAWRQDELVPPVAHGLKFAPSVVKPRIPAL